MKAAQVRNLLCITIFVSYEDKLHATKRLKNVSNCLEVTTNKRVIWHMKHYLHRPTISLVSLEDKEIGVHPAMLVMGMFIGVWKG